VTDHFNGLTEAEQERLSILIEECAEVIQAGCKILRHGYESKNPKIPLSETNRQGIERELGDLLHALSRLCMAGDLNGIEIERRRDSKPEHVEPYLHHQERKP
jgi:hypothetical protein